MGKFMKLLALAGVMAGLLGVAPNAHATSGDSAPVPPPAPNQPHTECAVSGQVSAPATAEGTVGHSNYQFESAILLCVGDFGGEYDVEALGGSWGPLQVGTSSNCTPTCEGSSTAVSWSDDGSSDTADKYNYELIRHTCDSGNPTVNKGRIDASIGSDTSSGWVKFLREASETLAWGEFCVGTLAGNGFHAELLFTPTGTETTKPGTGEPRDVYDLNGTAIIYAL